MKLWANIVIGLLVLMVWSDRPAFGNNLLTFEGHVIDVQRARFRHQIDVRGYKGVNMRFYTGMATRYQPERHPLPGERVRMAYYSKSGKYYVRNVTVLGAQATPAQSRPSVQKVVPAPKASVQTIVKPDILLAGMAMVTGSRVNIRSGPGTSYGVVANVVSGRMLNLDGQTRSWYYVFLPDQQQYGWISSKLVQVTHIESTGTVSEPSGESQSF